MPLTTDIYRTGSPNIFIRGPQTITQMCMGRTKK